MRAEVRALRAQISPHFIYNSLGAIASFVRTDPDCARACRSSSPTSPATPSASTESSRRWPRSLRSIERYLLLEQARFGDRLRVTLQVAPEVLGVNIPFLCLQPLVENAVRHGLEAATGTGQISIEARDADRECVIAIEDNGVGEDPERIRAVLAGETGAESIGLANVDERLRATFGDEYGLVVETAPAPARGWSSACPSSPPGSRHDRPADPGHRRRASRTRRDHLPARARRARLRGPRHRLADRGAAVAAAGRRRRGLPRHPDARATGIELAQVLSRFKTPPVAVFVTAHEQHAVDAFDLNAVDYVLKPVREDRTPRRSAG